MRSVSLLLPLVFGSALVGCSTGPSPRSPNAQAHLEQILAGKVAQAPIDCLHRSNSSDMIVIDDHTILFREGRRVYRNDLAGGSCPGLATGNILVTRQFGGQGLCRGEIAHVISPGSGMTVGSCVMGDFVPYTTAGG